MKGGIRERFADCVIDADRTSLRERTVVVPAERLAYGYRLQDGAWQRVRCRARR